MTKKEFIALYAERANFETKVDAEKKRFWCKNKINMI